MITQVLCWSNISKLLRFDGGTPPPHRRPPNKVVIALLCVVIDARYYCLHDSAQQQWCSSHVMTPKAQLVLLLANDHRLHKPSAHHAVYQALLSNTKGTPLCEYKETPLLQAIGRLCIDE
jgi:hypothetical protein